ncbi:MAG: membrane integrity-associated transporter subunit PqiC [Methylophagaceae bacterium]
MRTTFITLISILLSACSSAPTQINYYLLDATAVAYENKTELNTSKTITLKKLQLAHYLESVRLPLLQNNQGVVYASQHVWAEPLQLSISRVLVHDFKHDSKHNLRLSSMPNAQNSDFQLQIQIDHFSATDNSTVILSGSYWLNENEYSFHFKRALTADGFNHSVGQQRALISELVKMISVTISNQP